MRSKCFSLLCLSLIPTLCPADPFDIAEGNQTGLHTPEIYSVDRMFGVIGDNEGEVGATIFADEPPPDLIDFVEFTTREEIPLIGYTLEAASDGFVLPLRALRKFTLWADADRNGHYETKVDEFELLPAGHTSTTRTNFTMVVTDRFRAEFVRGDTPLSNGPRVIELDAIVAENAEAPTTNLDSPVFGSEYAEGTSILLEASAQDPHGIKRVEFWSGDTLLGEDTSAPYSFEWETAAPGDHYVFARAIDNLGKPGDSAATHIVVVSVPLEIRLLNPRVADNQFIFDFKDTRPDMFYQVERSQDLTFWEPFQAGTTTGQDQVILSPDLPHVFFRVVFYP